MASVAASQAVPTSQPPLLTIVREDVKTGHGAMHAAHEAGWPAAFAKAKSTDYYLALVAMTGPNETWYVGPYASHAAWGESMKREAADPVLTAELQRLARMDADHINSIRNLHAMAMPELSHGAFPDLALTRFWEITTFRVRPGQEEAFAAAAKVYAAAAKRAAPNASWRTYSVIAGMPGPTFLIFGSVKAFAEFDAMMKEGADLSKAFTPDEIATLQKSAGALISAETQRFRLDPMQSYVDAETKAKDPAFWNPPRRTTRSQ
jgi:hypothetical protein